MKNIFASILLLMLFSCSKQEISETNRALNRADSLFTKANEGIKSLDSLTKKLNDSNGIANKVIIPKLKEHAVKIDSTLRSGNWKIDSLNKEIDKISRHVKTGTEVSKELDSANQMLKNGENAISVLTKTADKILKRTQSKKTTAEASPDNRQNDNLPQTTYEKTTVIADPVRKSATLEIVVNDIENSKAVIAQKIRENNANLISEKINQKEGLTRAFITIKVRNDQFDPLLNELSQNIGDVTSVQTEFTGTEYLPRQLGDIEITLIEDSSRAALAPAGQLNTSETTGKKATNAFMSGFKVLENIFIALLPFWPLLLIGGVILYLIRRQKLKKAAAITNVKDPEDRVNAPLDELKSANENSAESIPQEPDYSKYMPKK